MTHPAEGSETGHELMPRDLGCTRCGHHRARADLDCPVCGEREAIALPPIHHGDVTDMVPAAPYDPVNRPAHYASGDIECADAIAAALKGETDPVVAWCRGNAIKYLWRAGKKDDAAQDLQKAAWYIERAITTRRAA
jgi:hypothetical protein